jgi:hypothetical protein
LVLQDLYAHVSLRRELIALKKNPLFPFALSTLLNDAALVRTTALGAASEVRGGKIRGRCGAKKEAQARLVRLSLSFSCLLRSLGTADFVSSAKPSHSLADHLDRPPAPTRHGVRSRVRVGIPRRNLRQPRRVR